MSTNDDYEMNNTALRDPDYEQQEDPLLAGVAKLEKSWFSRATMMRTSLVSPLHDAAAKGKLYEITKQVEQGADLNSLDEANNTPLHWAAGAGHLDATVWLLSQGAEVHHQNMLGDTPLHRATWREHLEVVKELLEAGSDISITNKMNQRPIDLIRGNVEIGALLQSHDPSFIQDSVFLSDYDFETEGNVSYSSDQESDSSSC
eukprot:TRINITY_DN4417_c0_g1_i2.p1 TRINITY_DN4417_c0_g1~~TRINITY_DN4417_c0_g1_i2.p1  ORF type:complete len:203 (-),score=43.91 TRINITY_DN4417_c0_g1_i2:31-639(-)